MVLRWPNGKWIHITYINRVGYEVGHYAFIQSVGDFKDIADRYGIRFENVLTLEVDGKNRFPDDFKDWF